MVSKCEPLLLNTRRNISRNPFFFGGGLRQPNTSSQFFVMTRLECTESSKMWTWVKISSSMWSLIPNTRSISDVQWSSSWRDLRLSMDQDNVYQLKNVLFDEMLFRNVYATVKSSTSDNQEWFFSQGSTWSEVK